MILTCPECSSAFDVPMEAFPKHDPHTTPLSMHCHHCNAVFAMTLPNEEQSSSTVQVVIETDKPSIRAKKRLRKIKLVTAAGLILLASVFFLTVFTNGRAFITDDIKNIESTVESDYKMTTDDGKEVLIALGSVVNNNETVRTHVIIEGQLVDESGAVFAKTQAPCGMIAKEATLKKKSANNLASLYKKKGRVYNCRLKPGWERKYQLVFKDLPPSYDDTFKVETTVVSARK